MDMFNLKCLRVIGEGKGVEMWMQSKNHQGLLVPILIFGSEIVVWRKNERS